MRIDFRNLNSVTTNQRTSQLPSIQAMEINFHDAFVTTIDLANCYLSIEIKEAFNFYVESEIWHHSRLPQGWGPSLQIAQCAINWTFKDSTLQLFILTKKLTPALFPYTSYCQFLQGFVDDLSIFTPKKSVQAHELHCLAINAVFFALYKAGWLVKLEVSTFMNPTFVFLGL